MITAFPGALPGLAARSFYPADTSNFPSIRNAIIEVEADCIDNDRLQYGGWQLVGSRKSIGVFLWSTRSLIDLRVGRAAHTVLPPLRGLNETVVGEDFSGTLAIA